MASSSTSRLASLLNPARTAVVTMELQNGIVKGDAVMAALPLAVAEAGVLPVAGAVCIAARAAGVRVVHGVAVDRADGAGAAVNCKIFALSEKRRLAGHASPIEEGSVGAALVDELAVDGRDIVVARIHGMTPFTSTSLDQILRNLGVTTIVLVGVSVNLGIFGAALTALDLGYQVVIVRDAVCGIPAEYAAQVLDNSLAYIATLATADDVIACWNA